ncbi:hypothetical protein PO461_07890 [Enterobacter asburiae]|uniref:hypothetical protein n=1 Tax=Enterobacter asburiae TaxID=61645 RepID=UPI002FF95DFB
MSNIDKRAQKELYAKVEQQAHSLRGNPHEYQAVTGMCPVNVIEMHAQKIQALLDELEVATDACNGWQKKYSEADERLEAAEKRLNEILTPNMLLPVIDELDVDNLRHVIKTVSENYSLLHAKWEASENRAEAAEKRIAELEARTLVTVEPTLDQLVAGKRRLTSTGRMSRLMSQRLAEVYRAMVNAAAAGKGEVS